jgi:hypothetical protein
MLPLRCPGTFIVRDILIFKMALLEIACLEIRPIFKGCADSLFSDLSQISRQQGFFTNHTSNNGDLQTHRRMSLGPQRAHRIFRDSHQQMASFRKEGEHRDQGLLACQSRIVARCSFPESTRDIQKWPL